LIMFDRFPNQRFSPIPLPACIAAIGDLSGSRIWAIVLGTILAGVAITLVIAQWTKWGQTKSLTKCIALAFVAHVWLLMYAYGTRIMSPGAGGGAGGGMNNGVVAMSTMHMTVTEQPPDDPSHSTENETASDANQADTPELKASPWEMPLGRPDASRSADRPPAESLAETASRPSAPVFVATVPEMSTLESSRPESPLPPAELHPMETEQDLLRMAGLASVQNIVNTVALSANLPSVYGNERGTRASMLQAAAARVRKVDQRQVPLSYQMRLSPDRQAFAMMSGGDANTESAVEMALAWLARAQGPDGGWNAAEHGAGREASAAKNRTDGEYRHNAGLKANTAMTGLALLAFLGAGHTHMEGRYADRVTSGLRYLMDQQLPSGDLSGREQVGREPTVRYARMYSHGMAALALTEAYSMTGDTALLPPIQSACRYTLNAMNPRTGGWRYEFPTEDPGDTSQFGWQAMVLHSSATNQAISVPNATRLAMQRFLDSVSTGRAGGLAVYRSRSDQMAPAEQATPAMTAEALSSRLLLGFPTTPQAADEATRLILKHQPGRSEENLYYWYYATLALYQMRGDGDEQSNQQQVWKQWNESLKQQLCGTQVPQGPNQGSWNPTCIWGGYGGRVYSTAVACMCLEVYYRYLPMYKSDQFATRWQPASTADTRR
jgi:hypothetical protein